VAELVKLFRTVADVQRADGEGVEAVEGPM
jgi:hypothetical protein